MSAVAAVVVAAARALMQTLTAHADRVSTSMPDAVGRTLKPTSIEVAAVSCAAITSRRVTAGGSAIAIGIAGASDGWMTPASAILPATIGGRYRRWGNEWWYWMPAGYWMFWRNGDWVRYDTDAYTYDDNYQQGNYASFNGPYYEDSNGFYYMQNGRRIYDPQIRRVANEVGDRGGEAPR
jgi:hypothetical protein